ncbi:MAG: hypothetical protein AVO35_12215 [Candidatus Aegiribacteria sp. MLS_C]|nr:MAG: hypothetical protein AVO35_12215 [Candidatus Aegiribacteria sp. MLS_C]
MSAFMTISCGRNFDTGNMDREQLEELADQVFQEGDFSGASRLYTELMFTYPGSPLMDLYLYRMGTAEAGNRFWADALFYFDRVQSEYPRSQWADDCSFQSARVWWEQRYDYRKDLTPVLNCREQLEDFYDRYPGSVLVEDADSLMSGVNDYLARRALFIGRFYTRRERYDAALLYLREALNDYGEPQCRGEILISVGDVYAAKGNDYTAREFYQRAVDQCDLTEEQLEEVRSRLDEL